jgi:hypothetical protein
MALLVASMPQQTQKLVQNVIMYHGSWTSVHTQLTESTIMQFFFFVSCSEIGILILLDEESRDTDETLIIKVHLSNHRYDFLDKFF